MWDYLSRALDVLGAETGTISVSTWSFIGAVVAGLSLYSCDADAASPCNGSTVYSFVDATTRFNDRDRDEFARASTQMMNSLAPGDRLVIVTIGATAEARTKPLPKDFCVPGSGAPRFEPTVSYVVELIGHLSQSRSDLAGARRNFNAIARNAFMAIMNQQWDTPATALVETISTELSDKQGISGVWLFSDGLESSLWPAELVKERHIEINAPLPRMDGIAVHWRLTGYYHDKDRTPLTSKELDNLVSTIGGWLGSTGAIVDHEPIKEGQE